MNAGDPYTTAQNGLEAVEAFKADRFKAVVMGTYTPTTASIKNPS